MAKAKPKTPTPPPPAPKKKTAAPPVLPDPALDHFSAGLSALQAKDWKKAVSHLEQAVETADRTDLRDKARQFLNVALQKGGGPADGKAAKSAEPDPYLQAVYERNRGDFKAALAIAQKGGRDQQEERFAYLAASIHAVENRLEDAAQALAKAVELNPKNRIHAFHDADFAELRKNRDQRHLFGLT